jgi:hypothetical protein
MRGSERRALRKGFDQCWRVYFTLAFAFLRSAQYFFIMTETALRAADDMRRVRFLAAWTA